VGAERLSPITKVNMPHPICGKCHSGGVYLDYELGQRILVCIICGNRYPGDREGFYMSGKAERPIEEKKVETAALPGDPGDPGDIKNSARRICITCGEKPTISDSCPYCGSCMNKKSREGKKGKAAPVHARRKETRGERDKAPAEKTPTIENMAVNIDFDKHPRVLKQVSDLADQEIRPLDLQIIYLLKCHFDKEA
jgi:hypothetical protein